MGVSERFQGANVVDAGRLSPYWGEHAARYVFAQELVNGAVVLDIACGTGYGVGLLQSKAAFVVGVDVDIRAAVTARSECAANAGIVLGDGLKLPFPDVSFDVVTSFETLEHLHDRPQFLAELDRVLKPGGKLILSTPNALYTRPVDGVPTNPFHVFEYSPQELVSELSSFFEIERFLGQRLNPSIRIPPFYEAQMRLPRDAATRSLLLGWKVMNKMPYAVRERVSEAVWGKSFYPMENDYQFLESAREIAPVLVAVCSKA